jgi:hypothetical protein
MTMKHQANSPAPGERKFMALVKQFDPKERPFAIEAMQTILEYSRKMDALQRRWDARRRNKH